MLFHHSEVGLLLRTRHCRRYHCRCCRCWTCVVLNFVESRLHNGPPEGLNLEIFTLHISDYLKHYFHDKVSIVFIHNNTLVLFLVPNNSHSDDDTSRGEGGAPNWHHKTSYSRPWRTQPQGSESTLGLSEVTKIAFIDWGGKQGLDTKISAFFEGKKIRKAKYFTPLIHLLFKKSWSKKKALNYVEVKRTCKRQRHFMSQNVIIFWWFYYGR